MAVELLNSGKTSSEIGIELGIGHDTARKWRKQLESRGDLSFPGNGKRNLTEQEREMIELKKRPKEGSVLKVGSKFNYAHFCSAKKIE